MNKMLTVSLLTAMIYIPGRHVEAEEWYETIKLKGDLRFRHEWIDQDGKDTRNRWRLRLRLGASAQVNEDLDVNLRLASGSDDPISTNQSLDSGFSTKNFGLDRAYLDWHPYAVEGLHVQAGKNSTAFYSY